MNNFQHKPPGINGTNRLACEPDEDRMLKLEREYQKQISQLAAENEELKSEIYLINHDLKKVVEEKDELFRLLEEKEKRMSEQLDIVTRTAYALYEKIRAFKCRYYGSAWTHAQQRGE